MNDTNISDINIIWLTIGGGVAFIAGLGALTWIGEKYEHYSNKQIERWLERKDALDAVVTIGEMGRIWYDKEIKVYRDATGKEVSTQLLEKEYILNYKQSEDLGTLLTRVECKGKVLAANAFSFSGDGVFQRTDPFQRDDFFKVLYHRV